MASERSRTGKSVEGQDRLTRAKSFSAHGPFVSAPDQPLPPNRWQLSLRSIPPRRRSWCHGRPGSLPSRSAHRRDLLSAEIAEKQARSIKYQLTIAKLPLAKDIDDFDFTGTPINEALIRDLASGTFLAEQRLPRSLARIQ
jgi:hypothetical protein